MLDSEYAQRFWALGNAIAGFAVVQNLGFAFTFLGSKIYCLLIEQPEQGLGEPFFYGILLFAMAYLIAIGGCWAFERHLIGEDGSRRTRVPSAVAAIFRGVVVLLFTGILLAMTSSLWAGKPGFDKNWEMLKGPTGCESGTADTDLT